MTRFLSRTESGDTSPHSIKRLLFFGVLFFTFTVFANDPIVDEGFDENGVKWILTDEVNDEDNELLINLDMTKYDSEDRGIPDAVMKLAGYPLDMDVRATMLGGISIYNRYQWGLSITREDTAGDGMSDLAKMRPPGWTEMRPRSPAFFTFSVETNGASATPLLPEDFVFDQPTVSNSHTWEYLNITLDNFHFPLGEKYLPSPVQINKWGALEFGFTRINKVSEPLPSSELAGSAVAVAWNPWQPIPRVIPGTNAVIVAGFRGEQRGRRYFFTRWENMEYARYTNRPLVTFEGRLFEDGDIEIHYLQGDFLIGNRVTSGAQCYEGLTGITIPRDEMVVSNKVTITQHYQLNPLNYNMTGDKISDVWKIKHKINPHDPNAASMVFNNEGLTLFECFEQRKNPWTAQPMHPPLP